MARTVNRELRRVERVERLYVTEHSAGNSWASAP